MDKEEARSAVMGAISMALKDPILQQGFEIICKNLAELEEENAELKTKKIPQLERRIASIRGCHSVDAKKLNARIEQVERLKKENAELKGEANSVLDNWCRGNDPCPHLKKRDDQLTKAKEIIKKFLLWENDWHDKTESKYELLKEAEQFLKDSEVKK